MKINTGFIKRFIADQYVVVAVGEAADVFSGLVYLNESSSLLWDRLLSGASVEDLVSVLVDTYDVSQDVASADVMDFISELNAIHAIDHEQ